MKKLTVALLAGGISSEREVSLQSGDQVYEALDKDKYHILRYDPKTDLGRSSTDRMVKTVRFKACLIYSISPIRVQVSLEVRSP